MKPPAFYKQHYSVVAELLREAYLSYLYEDAFVNLMDDFIEMFSADNPNFDSNLFRNACFRDITNKPETDY